MRKRFILGLIFSIVIIVVLLSKINLYEIWNTLKSINYFFVFFILFLIPCNLFFRSLRWKFLFGKTKDIKTMKLFRFLAIGILGNQILPLRLGEVARAYIAGKKLDISKSTCMATVVVERVFDALSFLVFLLVFIFSSKAFVVSTHIKGSFAIFFLIVISMFFLLLLSVKKKHFIIEKLSLLPIGNIKNKITNRMEFFLEGMHILHSFKRILTVFVFSLFIWLVEGLCYYVLFIAFNLNIGFLSAVFVMVIIFLGVLIPSGPAHVGIYEAACIGALSLFGIDKHLALSYAILIHSIQIIVILCLGVFSLFKEHLSFSEINISKNLLNNKKNNTK